ncbi:hypothetical protein EVG20_g8567 [Dentipellis fragilis]|uniref:Uncharacterized protein n=1 Tax=Dentipellis fragilis TaxID=205917 RepID=A0A4Y9Y5L6_9AGAM|nr:hypothetical protein EVG20_g8567 [Dentipellis fragilis]
MPHGGAIPGVTLARGAPRLLREGQQMAKPHAYGLIHPEMQNSGGLRIQKPAPWGARSAAIRHQASGGGHQEEDISVSAMRRGGSRDLLVSVYRASLAWAVALTEKVHGWTRMGMEREKRGGRGRCARPFCLFVRGDTARSLSRGGSKAPVHGKARVRSTRSRPVCGAIGSRQQIDSGRQWTMYRRPLACGGCTRGRTSAPLHPRHLRRVRASTSPEPTPSHSQSQVHLWFSFEMQTPCLRRRAWELLLRPQKLAPSAVRAGRQPGRATRVLVNELPPIGILGLSLSASLPARADDKDTEPELELELSFLGAPEREASADGASGAYAERERRVSRSAVFAGKKDGMVNGKGRNERAYVDMGMVSRSRLSTSWMQRLFMSRFAPAPAVAAGEASAVSFMEHRKGGERQVRLLVEDTLYGGRLGARA